MFLAYYGVSLGYIISKEGKVRDPKKILAIVHMPPQKTPKDIQAFNGMAQFYKSFIEDFAFIMVFITELLHKTIVFEWTLEHQVVWETIKTRCINTLILIAPRWDLEFHVHMDASNLVVKVMLAQNPTEKCD
jgi:hypothetical protein